MKNPPPLIISLLLATTLLQKCSSLTSSEESRLILHNDDGVIDEKLRELPGGILIPPEPQLLPVPTMDPQLPKINPPPRAKSQTTSRIGSYGQSSHVRSIVQSMRDRLKSSQSQPSTSFTSLRARSSSNSLLTGTPPNTLEMALKRIEILASRAGFNMSSIPRRSQLQIVSRLKSKLPTKMSAAVTTALKTNDVKVYEYLPEPARDPLIEDDPEFLGHFVANEDIDDFRDNNNENKFRIDPDSVSIAMGDHSLPQPIQHSYSESDLDFFGPPQKVKTAAQPQYEFLTSGHEESALESNHRKVVVPAYPTTTTTTTTTTKAPPPKALWSPPKRVILSTTTEPTTTTTTEPPTTTTTTPTPPPSSDSSETNSFRSSKDVKSPRPIKVSIVSDHQTITREDPIETGDSETSLKYVQVQQLSSKNASNLLFQVESPAVATPSNDEEPTISSSATPMATTSDDLTEDEIAAMVEELQKYDTEEANKNKGILEFQYQRLLEPHPLEYPDHPDHLDNKIKATTTTAASPTNKPPQPQQHRPHPPGHPGPPRNRPPPPPMMMMRPRHKPRPHPPGPPMLRINSVQVSEIPSNFDKDCDYFSNEICLLAKDYPVEEISSQLESNPSLALSLLPREESDSKSESSSTPEKSKLSSEGGFLCPSKVAYGKIKKAKSSTTGKWKWIVNYGDNTQTLRIEKCLTPGDKCSYVQPHYRTACTQVYNYHRLVSWDKQNGIHIDTYKIPTCCTCHVQGYYIPSQQPQSPAPLPPRGAGGPHPPPPQRRRVGGGPHNNHHHQPHPPHQLTNRRGPPPPPQQQPHPTSAAAQEEDSDLEDLLKQYALLRDKIAKTKGTSENSDLSTHLDFLLKKRKRSSSSSSTNSSPSLDYKTLLKKLHTEKNLRGKALLSTAKNYIRKKKSKSRTSRNMKTSDDDDSSPSKSSSSKSRLELLTLLKKIKEKKIKSHIKAKLSKHKSNYNHHPIMDYFNHPHPQQRQSRRMKLLRRRLPLI